MNSETVQRIFQAAETVLEELTDESRTTLKEVSTRISEMTGLSMSVVSSVVNMYIKNRSDLVVKRGRMGGIRRRSAVVETKVARAKKPVLCSKCGECVNAPVVAAPVS